MRSASIHDEQHQAALLVGAPLEEGYKFKLPVLMFIANGKGTDEIRIRKNLAR